MLAFLQKYTFLLVSLGIFVLYLGISLLSPGGLSVLDFVAHDFTSWKPWYSQTLQWHIVDILRYLLWGAMMSKIYYAFVYIFGIFAGYTLGNTIQKAFFGEERSNIFFPCIATLFLLLNPWIYERMVTQPGIVLGMFSLALTLTYITEHIFSPKRYSLLSASFFAGLAFLFFPHASVMLLLMGIFTLVFYGKHIPKKYFLITPSLIFMLNANWLFGDIFWGQELWTSAVKTFDWANIEGFTGNNLGISTELTHLLLYGFWGERFHILTPERFNPYWYIFGMLVLWVIVFGAIQMYKIQKRFFYFLLSLWIISYILALWISSPLFAPINRALYEYVPGYIGMREPQKWLGLTMIVYAIFFVCAVCELRKYFSLFPKWMPYLIVFTLLNTWNPMNLWAYQGQLLWISPPEEYALAREKVLLQEHEKVLILPWHSYMACSWTRWKVIYASQKENFYPLQTIVADNLEIATKYSNSSSPVSADIESFLLTEDISLLKKNNISHIIFQKNCGWPQGRYDFLEKKESFSPLFEGKDVRVFEIKENIHETK